MRSCACRLATSAGGLKASSANTQRGANIGRCRRNCLSRPSVWLIAADHAVSACRWQECLEVEAQSRPRGRLIGCAQHGRRLGGASPPERRPSQTKRTATAKGRPIVGRKQGAKPRADEQKPDKRRRRAGRVGPLPQSLDGQSSGYVDPAVVRGRTTYLPGEISPCA